MIYFVRKLIKKSGLIQLNPFKENASAGFDFLKCFSEIYIETLDTAWTKSKIKPEICIVL